MKSPIKKKSRQKKYTKESPIHYLTTTCGLQYTDEVKGCHCSREDPRQLQTHPEMRDKVTQPSMGGAGVRHMCRA